MVSLSKWVSSQAFRLEEVVASNASSKETIRENREEGACSKSEKINYGERYQKIESLLEDSASYLAEKQTLCLWNDSDGYE